MILKKEGFTEDKITQACYRAAQYMKVHIKEKEYEFTLKEALDAGEEFWINKKKITIDNLSDFLYMCTTYSPSGDIKLPTAKITLKIDCPNCHRCIMTKEQIKINSIELQNRKYIVCINCGEPFELIGW